MKALILGFSILLLSFVAPATNKKIKIFADKNLSSISYDMNHPMHDWTGTSKKLNSAIVAFANRDSISKVAVSVTIASFDSDNSNRDSHAMEVTEAIKYPTISFVSSEIKYNSANNLVVTGTLNFHGIKKSITFPITKTIVKEKALVKGEFKVKMTDYGIAPPTLMGIATDDEFRIYFQVYY